MADKKPNETRPRGSGQRTVEQGRGTGQVGRASSRGVQGRAVPHAGPSSAKQAEDQRANAARETAQQEQEDARQAATGDADPIGDAPVSHEEAVASRDAELGRAVNADLRRQDTTNYPASRSTPSQQPTMLESRGGTEQPHPTMAPRAAVSSMQGGAPGRSHDRVAAARRQLQELGGASPNGTLLVRATQMGYYDNGTGASRRREGDIFALVPREGIITEWLVDKDSHEPILDRNDNQVTREVRGILTPEEQFSERWMEVVNQDEAERVTTAQEAIDAEHDRIIGERGAANRRSAAGRFNDQAVAE